VNYDFALHFDSVTHTKYGLFIHTEFHVLSCNCCVTAMEGSSKYSFRSIALSSYIPQKSRTDKYTVAVAL